MIDVAPLCEDNTRAFLLPVLESSLVAFLIFRSEFIFLLERLATEELVELGVILHSLTAAVQNLLEKLMVLAARHLPLAGAAAVAEVHLKGGQSIVVVRILQVQEAGKAAAILFGNGDLRIDGGIVVVVDLRFHINDVSTRSILVDEVAVGLGNPITFGLRRGIESMPSSSTAVTILHFDESLDDGGEAVWSVVILAGNGGTLAILQIGNDVVDEDLRTW